MRDALGCLAKRSCGWAVLSAAAGLALGAPAFAAPQGWLPLGTRWAAELDAQGTALGIFDLSYPELGSGNAAIDLGKIASDRLQGDWAEGIRWKPSRAPLVSPPERFTLGDLDLDPTLSDDWDRRWHALAGAAARADAGGFLDHFELSRQTDGSYAIAWLPTPLPGNELGSPSGRQIANLSDTKAGMVASLEIEAFSDAVGAALGLISDTVVSALVGVATDRFFHCESLMRRTHEDMTLEMLAEVADLPWNFERPSFAALTEDELSQAVEAIYYEQGTLLTSWQWLWTSPAAMWKSDRKSQRADARESLAWLEGDADAGTYALGPRFTLVTDPAGTERVRIDLVSREEPDSELGPLVGVHEPADGGSAPIIERRVAVEAAVSTFDFAASFIPWVGGLVSSLYKLAVQNPEDSTRRWEARLVAQLEERELQHGEDWRGELALLADQRLNPLELSPDAAAALVARRRAALGLPPLQPPPLERAAAAEPVTSR